jgi:hypothetical protein
MGSQGRGLSASRVQAWVAAGPAGDGGRPGRQPLDLAALALLARRARVGWPEQLAFDTLPKGVAHLAVDGELFLFGAARLARVGEAPVPPLLGAEEHGAGRVGLVAHGDDQVERLVEVALERLALLAGDVDAQLGHGADRERAHLGRLGARRQRLEALVTECPQQPLGNLRASGVVGTQEQDAMFVLRHGPVSLRSG